MELLSEINLYLDKKAPLGIHDYKVSLIGAGEYNINYLVQTPDKKLVLRVSISQLSGAKDQLKHEYNTLSYLKDQNIAPDVYYLDMDGFRYPILIEEYIAGSPITQFDKDTLTQIGRAIGAINNVPINRPHPFEVRTTDYTRDIYAQEAALKAITPTSQNKEYLDIAHQFIANARTRLEAVKPNVRPMLIRRDANPTNFILTNDGIRLVDWEITRLDDPTITLASFINEVALYDVLELHPSDADMDIVKRAFLEVCEVPNFDELLHNQLILEQLGGLVWGLERIDNASKAGVQFTHTNKKLAWYDKVIHNSLQALSETLKP